MENNLRKMIYKYQNEICFFNKMQVLAMSTEEKNHYINLIQDKTEDFIISLQQNETNEQQTEPNNSSQADTCQIEFTIEELANYNGSKGKPPYVAVNGIVYDMSDKVVWGGGTHFGLFAGKDLTANFMGCHNGMTAILDKLHKVGVLKS